MNWNSLAPILLKLGLPALKVAITAGAGMIPVVGAFIGPEVADAVGNMIAKAFGVDPTPEAVKEVITNTPNAEVIAKLSAVQAEAIARWPAIAKVAEAEEVTAQTQIDATTTQMKQEILAASTISENSRWKTITLVMNSVWRPLFALEWLLECFVFFVLFVTTLIRSDQFDVDTLVRLQTIILTYMAARFGLVGWHMNLRTREKESINESVTDTKPVSMDDIKNMLKGQGVKVK